MKYIVIYSTLCIYVFIQQTKKLLTMEAEECHSVSHSVPFAQTVWLANAHCIASLEWIKPFVSATLSILGPHQDSSLRYPVLALCHWHSAALILQDWPLHELRQLIGGVDVGVGHLQVLDQCLVGSWVDLSAWGTNSPSSSTCGVWSSACGCWQGE